VLGAETVAGRLRPLPDIASRDETDRARAERQAVNTVIQGSAADLMKEAMIRTCAALSTRGVSTARLIAQVITCDCAGDYM
jgi:DNA polymerase-1